MTNPLHLYRSILRVHRLLPKEMRFVGDQYVRAEFRSHQTVTDKRYLEPFFAQWTSYLDLLRQQTQGTSTFGQPLDSTVVDKLDDDKAEQLLDLHSASTGQADSEHAQPSSTPAGSPKRT